MSTIAARSLSVRGHVVGRRVDVDVLALGEELAGQRVDLGDPLDLVAEELDADDALLARRAGTRGCRRGRGTARARGRRRCAGTGGRRGAGARESRRYEPPCAELEDGRAVVDRRADAVDAAHRRDDDHVAALEQRVRRGVPQPVDLVVAGRVLLDVRVAPGQVRLGLVVVEVADEVLDRVVREEVAELRVQLRGEGLVVGEDERRPLGGLDDLGDRQRLAGPGRAEQDLVVEALREAVGQALDRLGLVAGGLERGDEAEVGHAENLPSPDRNRTPVRRSCAPTRSRPSTGRWRCVLVPPAHIDPGTPSRDWREPRDPVADRAALPAIRPDARPAPGRHAATSMEMEYKDTNRRGKFVIIVGVVLAVAAGAASFYLINQAQQTAGQGDLQKTPVVVAAQVIPARTPILAGALEVREIVARRGHAGGNRAWTRAARRQGPRDPGRGRPADLLEHDRVGRPGPAGFAILGPDETVAPDSAGVARHLDHDPRRARGRGPARRRARRSTSS